MKMIYYVDAHTLEIEPMTLDEFLDRFNRDMLDPIECYAYDNETEAIERLDELKRDNED